VNSATEPICRITVTLHYLRATATRYRRQ